jgi:hypothetical protein
MGGNWRTCRLGCNGSTVSSPRSCRHQISRAYCRLAHNYSHNCLWRAEEVPIVGGIGASHDDIVLAATRSYVGTGVDVICQTAASDFCEKRPALPLLAGGRMAQSKLGWFSLTHLQVVCCDPHRSRVQVVRCWLLVGSHVSGGGQKQLERGVAHKRGIRRLALIIIPRHGQERQVLSFHLRTRSCRFKD